MALKHCLFEKSDFRYDTAGLANTGSALVCITARGSQNLDNGDAFGYIELCARTSEDGGKTWSAATTIAAPPARQNSLQEGNMKSSFFLNPCLTATENGELLLLATFFPESLGMAEEKLLDKKKVAYAGFDGKTYPLIYDRDGNYFMVLPDGTVLDAKKTKTAYRVEGFGELYREDEYLGNIYLNGAMGKSDNENKTTFGAPLKAPKRSYLLQFTSRDNGKSWSAPTDITAQVLHEDDGVLLSTAGSSGLVTKSGRIILPLASQKGAVCIYSDNFGASWNRNHRLPYLPIKGSWAAVQAPSNELFAIGDGVALSPDNGITWIKDKLKGIKQKGVAVANGRTLYIATAKNTVDTACFAYKKQQLKGIQSEKASTPTGNCLAMTLVGESLAVITKNGNEEVFFEIV